MKTSAKKLLLLICLPIFLLLTLDLFILSRLDEEHSIYRERDTFGFPQFSTKDLSGNIITQNIFTDKFSIVCIWITSDAANGHKLLKSLFSKENASTQPVQFIGIIGDVRDTDPLDKIAIARSIVGDLPNIPQLLVNDDLEDFLRHLRNVPTVCFVDEQGTLVGQPVIGNEPELIQKEVNRLIKLDSRQRKLGQKIQNNLFYRP